MSIYYQDGRIMIRSMIKEDISIFYNTYFSYGWHPTIDTYEKYYDQQINNSRKVFVALCDGKIVGMCSLLPRATNGPFLKDGYPQIEDLSVFIDMRNQGIGNKLLDIVEAEAFKTSKKVCLAVGLHSGYGQAQRIYVKRGYNFDGSGLWYQDKQLDQYAPCNNDDELLLYMIKEK